LSNRGNGTYAYIDDFSEARKVLVDQMSGTLFTIAKDVKIQVEFNPARVSAYRLIGYENRRLNKEDFNDDKVDAGDIGAGHTVTACYELVLVDGESGASVPGLKPPAVDRLKYQRPVATPKYDDELLNVKIRYKHPHGDTSRKQEFPLAANARADMSMSAEFRFAAAVAGFGMLLRGEDLGGFSYDQVLDLADDAMGEDKFGYRREFLNLVRNANIASGK
jgi:Ca-activated chloride channel family protein